MKILFFTFIIVTGIAQRAIAQISLQEGFDKLLMTQFKANEPGGVVMVAQNGVVIYKKAFGMANLELNVPTNDSMIFNIGSNTKQFTSVAILQLVEKGKLNLQDSLGRFIPFAPPAVNSITVQQLLSQTSGIDEKNEKNIKAFISGDKPENLVRIDIAPGIKWEYNNTNYSILGYIIEKITGSTYTDYVVENIFKPAGMENSYIDNEVSIIKNRASGYRNFKNRFLNSRISGKIGAAGGIQSTVNDLLKWNTALKSGILLKRETLQQAIHPQKLLDGTITGYGFGWYLEELHGSPTWRHGGMVPGYTAETLYLPKEDVYIVILTNTEFSLIPITALSRILAGMAIGKPYIFENMPIDKAHLKKYVGLYENDLGEQLNIAERNGGLIFQRPNGAQYKLGYAGGNEFFLGVNFMRINFIPHANGKISSLKFSKVDIGATEWFKTQKPLLNLSSERIADSLLKHYEGKYFLPGSDTVIINRDGPNLYLKMENQELLLAAADNTHFFALKNNLQIQFSKGSIINVPGLILIKDKKKIKYFKL
ncbi:MAG: serine hydrolase [Terrimonas sp.]|nr:serine hydrolase [Terrimonas sp.]OJY92110.1 MAG: hypothetical protein BGP13_08040 [Sphingobacteriales bacterium 40-81]